MTVDQLIERLREFPGFYEVAVEYSDLEWDDEKGAAATRYYVQEPDPRRDECGRVLL